MDGTVMKDAIHPPVFVLMTPAHHETFCFYFLNLTLVISIHPVILT